MKKTIPVFAILCGWLILPGCQTGSVGSVNTSGSSQINSGSGAAPSFLPIPASPTDAVTGSAATAPPGESANTSDANSGDSSTQQNPQDTPITVVGNTQGVLPKPGRCPNVTAAALDVSKFAVEGTEAVTGRLQIDLEGDFHFFVQGSNTPSTKAGQRIHIIDSAFPHIPPMYTYTDSQGHFAVTISSPAGRQVIFDTQYCGAAVCYELSVRNPPEATTFVACPTTPTPPSTIIQPNIQAPIEPLE